MFIQSGVRVQKPKGYKMKQGFQLALIVAFGIWVLYQTKNSNGNNKDHNGTKEHLVDLKRVTIVLGRKAHAGSTEEHNVVRNSVVDEVDTKPKEKLDDRDNFHSIIGFPDENGVPIDGPELAKFSPNFDEQETTTTTTKDQAVLRSQRVIGRMRAKFERRNSSLAERVHGVAAKLNVEGASVTVLKKGVALMESNEVGVSDVKMVSVH